MTYSLPADKTTYTLTSEVLRCYGFEKNLQAISLSGPESLVHALEKQPELLALLPAEARAYATGQLAADYAEYHALTRKVAARNAGDSRALTQSELERQIALKAEIREKLAPAVISAVLQLSGLVSAQDVAEGRVNVNTDGMVRFAEGFKASEEQAKAAYQYVMNRQAEYQPDGSWKSYAARSAGGAAAAKG